MVVGESDKFLQHQNFTFPVKNIGQDDAFLPVFIILSCTTLRYAIRYYTSMEIRPPICYL